MLFRQPGKGLDELFESLVGAHAAERQIDEALSGDAELLPRVGAAEHIGIRIDEMAVRYLKDTLFAKEVLCHEPPGMPAVNDQG